MRYVSTRGQAPRRDFAGVLLAGLAEDGGLYVPETWPALSAEEWRRLRSLPYPALAARLLALFMGDAMPSAGVEAICEDAYAAFGHPAVVPLVQLETSLFVQELFHGPTLAFKDMAMQVLGRLFDRILAERAAQVTIIGATSGDTGSAAIEAFADRDRVNIVILHPRGRTSEVQRRQMTTVHAANVANIAVEGTFDDCQDLVKAMFADADFRAELRLSAVNSINWARIAAQIPYYAAAALALGAPDRAVAFSVPTGNFGNVFAAWAAGRMGLPLARLLVASNRNDILTRFLDANDMSVRDIEPSLSPSMDIQSSAPISSACCSSCSTATRRRRRRRCGSSAKPDAWRFPKPPGDRARELFAGFRLDDAGTEAEIARLWAACRYLADPHGAIGIAAARALPVDGIPMSRWQRRIRPNSPTRCSGRPGIAPPCRRASPIWRVARSGSVWRRTISARFRA